MSNELFILAFTAAGIGFIHTILGLDHYLPFIALAKARKWNIFKTALITFLCGLGFVVVIAVVFGGVTISTMVGVVLFFSLGLSKWHFFKLEKYSHALAGFMILFCVRL